MREGYASVVRAPGRIVRGVLWDLAVDDIPALDRYEGVSGGLYTKASLPVRTTGGVKRALIYLGGSAAPGRPRPGYLEAVVAAARAAQLPPAYVRELSSWSRGLPAWSAAKWYATCLGTTEPGGDGQSRTLPAIRDCAARPSVNDDCRPPARESCACRIWRPPIS